MTDLERVIHSPEQKSAEFWQKASDMVSEHTDQLERVRSVGGDEFLVTPSFVPIQNASFDVAGDRYTRYTYVNALKPATKAEERVLKNSFSIAAQVHRGKGYQPGNPLYLIINDQVTAPLLKFEAGTTRLMVLDGSFASLEKSDDLIDKILGYVDKALDAKKDSIESFRHQARWSRRLKAVAVVAFAGAAAGAFGFMQWREGLIEVKKAAVAAFDARNVDLQSAPLDAGEASFAQTAPVLFVKSIPKVAGDEKLDHPRRFSVKEGTCKEVDTIDPATENVRVVTSSPEEQIYVAVKSGGEVQVCSFETPNDSDENSETSFEVAVQTTPRPAS